VSSGQIGLSRQIWTLRPLPNEFSGNPKYRNPREFFILSNSGRTQNFDLERMNYDQLKLNGLVKYDFSLQINFMFLSILPFC
jgi:hypothetical protein